MINVIGFLVVMVGVAVNWHRLRVNQTVTLLVYGAFCYLVFMSLYTNDLGVITLQGKGKLGFSSSLFFGFALVYFAKLVSSYCKSKQ